MILDSTYSRYSEILDINMLRFMNLDMSRYEYLQMVCKPPSTIDGT